MKPVLLASRQDGRLPGSGDVGLKEGGGVARGWKARVTSSFHSDLSWGKFFYICGIC